MEQVRDKLYGNHIIRVSGHDPPFNQIHIYVQHGGLVRDFTREVVDYKLDIDDTIWVSTGDAPLFRHITIVVCGLNNTNPDPWKHHLFDLRGFQPDDTLFALAKQIALNLYPGLLDAFPTWQEKHRVLKKSLESFKIVFRTDRRNWVVWDYQKELQDYGLDAPNTRVWVWQGDKDHPIPENLNTTGLRDPRGVRFAPLKRPI